MHSSAVSVSVNRYADTLLRRERPDGQRFTIRPREPRPACRDLRFAPVVRVSERSRGQGTGQVTVGAGDLRLRIAPSDAMPLYLQIAHQLKQLIMTGELADSVQLPAVRSLALHLGVNPGTVMQAYRELSQEGLTASIRGRGSVVRTLSGRSADAMARERLLDAAVRRLVSRGRALGFEPVEVQQRLNAALLHDSSPVRIVFLGVTAAHAARYTRELNDRYAARAVRFVPYSVADLQHRDESLLAEFKTAYTVVTFAPRVPEVERTLDTCGVAAEIIGVRAELSVGSRRDLAAMSDDRSYVLITEKRAVPTIMALIDAHGGVDRNPVEVVASGDQEGLDPRQVGDVVDSEKIIIYSFGVREQVAALNLPRERLLELKFEFTDATWVELDRRWGPVPGVPARSQNPTGLS